MDTFRMWLDRDGRTRGAILVHDHNTEQVRWQCASYTSSVSPEAARAALVNLCAEYGWSVVEAGAVGGAFVLVGELYEGHTLS